VDEIREVLLGLVYELGIAAEFGLSFRSVPKRLKGKRNAKGPNAA
jgi:hypothetical protein